MIEIPDNFIQEKFPVSDKPVTNLEKIRAFLKTLTMEGAEPEQAMPTGEGMQGYIRWEHVGRDKRLRVYVNYSVFRGKLNVTQIRIMVPDKAAVYLPYHCEPDELAVVVQQIVNSMYEDTEFKSVVEWL